MVRLSLTSAFVASLLAVTAFASPIERETFVKVPVKTVSVGTPSGSSLVAHGQARISKINKAAASSGVVDNDVVSISPSGRCHLALTQSREGLVHCSGQSG
jgi:hypothetical protein